MFELELTFVKLKSKEEKIFQFLQIILGVRVAGNLNLKIFKSYILNLKVLHLIHNFASTMNPVELKERTKLLGHTCTKLALLLPPNNLVAMHLRNELLAVAVDLPSKTRGLLIGQSTANFVRKLSDCSELADRCGYILEFIEEEKMMESHLITPLIDECAELIKLFYSAFKSVKDKLD